MPDLTYLKSLLPVKILGRGLHGVVLLMFDARSNKNFALKVTKEDDLYKSEETALRKLEGEPFCCQLYRTYQIGQHQLFLMDYYSGGSVQDLMRRMESSTSTFKLSVRDVQVLVAETIIALSKLHEKDIVHRDIKPDNVLFDGDGHIVLADFGISDVLKGEDRHSSAKKTDLCLLMITISDLCNEETMDTSWTEKKKKHFAQMCSLLEEHNPRELNTIRKISGHAFFKGLSWDDVAARKGNMDTFRPQNVDVPKPSKSGCEGVRGSLKNSQETQQLMESLFPDVYFPRQPLTP